MDYRTALSISSVCARMWQGLKKWAFGKELKSKTKMAHCCPHCKNLRGWWGCLPCRIFTRAPRIFAMFLHWQHQLLLICTHATLFRHSTHIRLWLHCQNKWAALRRHKLTKEAVVKMGYMEIWSLFTLRWESLKTNFQPINYRGVAFLHLSTFDN